MPDGADESANVVLRQHGEPPRFDFTPRQHFEIGEALGLMDFAAAAKLAGSRFTVLRGALARLAARKVPYISVLTNPSTAGVMASYASLGDVIIAEPDALIGFAGPRVIQQTINQILPKGFQKSDFVLEHGFLDMVVERKDMKDTLSKLLFYLCARLPGSERAENPSRSAQTGPPVQTAAAR